MLDPHIPYILPLKHLQTLANVVSNKIDEGDHTYSIISEELGVAQARQNGSTIKKLMPTFFGNSSVTIYLTEEERKKIVELSDISTIREHFTDGI